MSAPFDLTVIVPTFERPRVLDRNLEALAASEGVDLGRVEVIVVDDGSTGDATRRLLEARADTVPFELVAIRQENAGQARARNVAMERARGRIFLFINDDTIAAPGLLAAHLRAHARHAGEEAGILGRVTLAPTIPMTTPRALHLDHMWSRLAGRTELEWHHFWTTNVSVKAAFLKRHGLAFEPTLRYVHDDTEMGYRLGEHGFRLHHAPDALGYHDHPITDDGFLRMAEREADSLVGWARRRPEVTPDLARFGFTPTKQAWERRLKYPLLALVFNRTLEPAWRLASRVTGRALPPFSRFLLSQCYAARKRRRIAAALEGKPETPPAVRRG